MYKRFGSRQGVCPQKVPADFQAFTPARTFVFSRPTPSHRPCMLKRPNMKRLTIILIWLLTIGKVNADIAPNPIVIKSIYTVDSCKIQMTKEYVYADLYNDSAIVVCTFELLNLGNSTTIQIGFPEMNFQYWSIGEYAENDVIVLLKNIKENGIDVWIDGGWGVDALLGRQTRPHNDIDVFIQRKDRAAFTKMLILNGYRETNMEYTTDDHIVWRDPNNRIVDLHLFEFSEKGTFRYDNEIYSSDILNGQGVIGDIPVRCLTPEAQLLYHQGYEYDEKDVHDVMLLCETFGLSLPEEYKKH